MRLAAILAVTTGCVVIRRDPATPGGPSKAVVGFHDRFSLSQIDEPAPDGADGPGLGFGLQLFAAGRVAPRTAIGICLDVAVLPHGTAEPGTSALYWFGDWGALARQELDHLTLEAWGTWYFGHRSLSESDAIGSKSGVDLRGPGLGVAGRWRIPVGDMPSLEIGPFVQIARLHAIEDESRTEFDEDGMEVTSVQVGLAIGIAFGAAD